MKPQFISRLTLSTLLTLWSSFCLGLLSPAPVEAKPPAASSDNIIVYQSSQLFNSEISRAIVTLQGVGGRGTGSIIKASGWVLTSEHIISHAHGGQVSVVTHDGVQHPGKVIAVDEDRDLALIKILTRQTFSTLPLADRNSIRLGQTVYALDDPFTSLENLIRGKLQKITGSTNLYTNLVLSPGDSGGPLLNSQGEIVGVNRAVIRFQSTEEQSTWGLANHLSTVYQFLEEARSGKLAAVSETRNRQGINLGITVSPDTLEIIKVEANSLADRWGLRPGDEIVGYNHRHIDSLAAFEDFLASNPSEVLLFLRRNDYLVRLRMRL